MITHGQPCRAVGLIHADSVMPVVRSSTLASGMLTMLEIPLKLRALPNLPVVTHAVPVRLPVRLFPDESTVVVPPPSSKP